MLMLALADPCAWRCVVAGATENSPPSSEPAFLKQYAAATWGGMASHDPGAIWVLQAWAFGAGYWTNARLEAYLSGVSNAHMLLLDLVSDQMPLW